MSKYLKISLFCFVLSIFYYVFHLIFLPQISIGIVGVDNISQDFLKISKNGFDENYIDYFNTSLIDFRINSSNISIEGGYYKNADFFRVLKTNLNIEKLNYDYYLIVTDKKILDYDESSSGFWGQASTEYNMALITTAPFSSGNQFDNFTIANHGVHEVLHLVGYLHNIYDFNGIMQYKNVDKMNLAYYYNFQLPVKIFWSKYFKIENFILNAYFKNLVFFPFLFFLFLGLEYLIKFIEDLKFRYVVADKRVFLGYNLILFIFGVFYNYVFYLFILILFFQICLHLYVLEQKKYIKF